MLGDQIPVVIVGENNLFRNYQNVDGVIGYDIFVKFEVEINARYRIITFPPALNGSAPHGYMKVPLHIVDVRPVMASEIFLDKNTVGAGTYDRHGLVACALVKNDQHRKI